MSDLLEEVRNNVKRSISDEFVRMEQDFDSTRSHREIIIDKLVSASASLSLTDDKGNLSADSKDKLTLINTTLKALADKEAANSRAIGLKLKNQEQEISSAAEARERIEMVLRATAPSRPSGELDTALLDKTISDLFDDDIKDTELRLNHRDLS